MNRVKAAIKRLIEAAGHHMADYTLLPNNEARVRGQIRALVARNDVDAVLITGGTGLGSKDRTVEAVRSVIEKELPRVRRALSHGVVFRSRSGRRRFCRALLPGRLEWEARGLDAGVRRRRWNLPSPGFCCRSCGTRSANSGDNRTGRGLGQFQRPRHRHLRIHCIPHRAIPRHR